MDGCVRGRLNDIDKLLLRKSKRSNKCSRCMADFGNKSNRGTLVLENVYPVSF